MAAEAAIFVPSMPDVAFFTVGSATMVRLTYSSGQAFFERIVPFDDWRLFLDREAERLRAYFLETPEH